MGDLVNLRRARKDKARAEREKLAAENRSKFGRPKAEREADELKRAIEAQRLDGHRRED